MSQCEKCTRILPSGRRRGLCETCRRLCPQCGQPNGRANSTGYCPACQRERRLEKRQVEEPIRRRRKLPPPGPGLRTGQIWYPNPTREQRLPVEQITLDIERTVHVLRTFYAPEEYRRLVELIRANEENTGS